VVSADEESVELLAALVSSVSESNGAGFAFSWLLDGPGVGSHSGVGEPERAVASGAVQASTGVTTLLGVGVVAGSRFGMGAGDREISGVTGALYCDQK